MNRKYGSPRLAVYVGFLQGSVRGGRKVENEAELRNAFSRLSTTLLLSCSFEVIISSTDIVDSALLSDN